MLFAFLSRMLVTALPSLCTYISILALPPSYHQCLSWSSIGLLVRLSPAFVFVFVFSFICFVCVLFKNSGVTAYHQCFRVPPSASLSSSLQSNKSCQRGDLTYRIASQLFFSFFCHNFFAWTWPQVETSSKCTTNPRVQCYCKSNCFH